MLGLFRAAWDAGIGAGERNRIEGLTLLRKGLALGLSQNATEEHPLVGGPGASYCLRTWLPTRRRLASVSRAGTLA